MERGGIILNNFQLRDAVPEDAAEIARLIVRSKEESFPGPFEPYELDFGFWENRWRGYLQTGSRAQFSRGDGFAILACEADLSIGFGAYHHTARWGCDAELQSLYVLANHQGRGVGTALLREIVRRLKADGSGSLCVGYAPDNPFRRFYRKHGAEEINPHWAVWRDLP